jgi:hypothetical protein
MVGADIAALATLKLSKLSIEIVRGGDAWGEAAMQSFVGSNISQTLKSFRLSVYYETATPIDDVQVATAFASCHNLKKLAISLGNDDAFMIGRNGLDGLQAMATGCPLLTDVSLPLTIGGIHYLGTHFTHLKTCMVDNRRLNGARTPVGFPSIEELQTLYPAVKWRYKA